MTRTGRAQPSKLTTRVGSSFRIVLPGTSANLGSAFDTAALALSLFLKIRARTAEEFFVSATGRDAAICSDLRDHLILTTYKEVLASERKPAQPLRLHIINRIPIGKGCGSSAAARLAGIALAVHFAKLPWKDERIIAEAAVREHHPDNAAACWMGGLAIARMRGEQSVVVARVIPKGKWPLLLAVPDEALSTEQARRVLPANYSRQDAVANVQNTALLVAAFTQGRHDLLAAALEDRFHQPYRAPLCPLLPALQEATGQFGIAGVALSGAGPSVLVFPEPKADLQRVKANIARLLRQQRLSAAIIPTKIAHAGACQCMAE